MNIKKAFVLVSFTSFSLLSIANEQSQLNSQKVNLEIQISTLNNELKELIKAKNKTKNIEEKNKKVDEIKKIHQDLLTSIDKYNHTAKELRFRYPEKGDSSVKKYIPMKKKTIDQIEEEMGLDAVLTATKAKADEKYKPIIHAKKKRTKAKEELVENDEKSETYSDHQKDEEKKRLRLVK